MTPQEFKQRRTRLGLSQSMLAGRLGVTKQTIINYERPDGDGPPPMAALAIMALDNPVGPLNEMAIASTLETFVSSVLAARDADAAVAALDEHEDIVARARPLGMGYEESKRLARTFAFERLIEVNSNQKTQSFSANALAEALMRPEIGISQPRYVAMRNELAASLLGKRKS